MSGLSGVPAIPGIPSIPGLNAGNPWDPPAASGGAQQWLRKAEVIFQGGSVSATFSAGSPASPASTPLAGLAGLPSIPSGVQPGQSSDGFRFTFNVEQRQATTYAKCRVRIYNLSDKTVNTLIAAAPAPSQAQAANSDSAIAGGAGGGAAAGAAGNPSTPEFTKLVLNAGYMHGNYGCIFSGTIVQFTIGRERNVDSFLEVVAQDGDETNFVAVSQTLAGPVNNFQQIQAIAAAANSAGVSYNPATGINAIPQYGGTALPRGKVLYGEFTNQIKKLSTNTGGTWVVQRGQLKFIPLRGYLPGDVIVINSQTGLIGTPETTTQGITLVTLLNPNYVLGQRIRLNQRDVNRTILTTLNRSPDEGAVQIATVSGDGTYRLCSVEYAGDTRGGPWYSNLVALSIDVSAPPATSVQQGQR